MLSLCLAATTSVSSSDSLLSPPSSPFSTIQDMVGLQHSYTKRTSSAPLEIGPLMEVEECDVIGQAPRDRSPSMSPTRTKSGSLSSSAESLHSVRSNCSNRSSMEREAERTQRRHLLNVSISKIQDAAGCMQPLRRHLLVFNTIKQLQKDLDCLDDEELYSCLLEEQPMNVVKEDRWLEKGDFREGETGQSPTFHKNKEAKTADTNLGVPQEKNMDWDWSGNEEPGLHYQQEWNEGCWWMDRSVSEERPAESCAPLSFSPPAPPAMKSESSSNLPQPVSSTHVGWACSLSSSAGLHGVVSDRGHSASFSYGRSSSPVDDDFGEFYSNDYSNRNNIFGFEEDAGVFCFEWDSAPLGAAHLSARDLLHLLPMQA